MYYLAIRYIHIYSTHNSWRQRGFCRLCLPADNNVSSFTYYATIICTPVIWLFFLLLFISRRPTVDVSNVSGEFIFLFFNLHTGRHDDEYVWVSLYLYIIIKIAYARARVLIFRRRRHRVSSPPKIGFCTNTHTQTYTRIIIYIYVCACGVYFYFIHTVFGRGGPPPGNHYYTNLSGGQYHHV